MHCGVMVTGYNQGDWERLMAEDYDRPPTVPDSQCMDDTLYMGELVEPLGFDSIWATEHYGSAYSMQPNPLQYLAYWALDILLKGRRLHLGIGRGISPHEYASLGYPMEESHKYFYDVINAIRVADGAERFEFQGDVYNIPPTSIRPQARHKGELTKNIKVAFSTEASAKLAAENGLGQMFVAGDDVTEMINKVQRFNKIRKDLGLPPDQPTTLLWMYCAETAEEAEEGWVYFKNQGIAAQHHYFDWNNPGYEGIRGYEEYLLRQNADISPAESRLAARRATQPIGTPDTIIEKIKTMQQTISMEKVVIHMMYGGMPREKAEKSLRLFSEKVLPEVQSMPTPINPGSLG